MLAGLTGPIMSIPAGGEPGDRLGPDLHSERTKPITSQGQPRLTSTICKLMIITVYITSNLD